MAALVGWFSFAFAVNPAHSEELPLAQYLDQPNVKVVAVQFYAMWCKPCLEAVPNWERLRKQYHPQGFRLVVVETQAKDSRCPRLGWNPDDAKCDLDNTIGDFMKVSELPSAFLWSWDGRLLVTDARDWKTVAAELKRFLAQNPRVEVRAKSEDSRPFPLLKNLLKTEISKQGKFTVVNSETQGFERPNGQEVKECSEPGIPSNSVLQAEFTGSRLTLSIVEIGGTCQTSASAPWTPAAPQAAARAALQSLMAKISRRPPQMPGERPTNRGAPSAPTEPQSNGLTPGGTFGGTGVPNDRETTDTPSNPKADQPTSSDVSLGSSQQFLRALTFDFRQYLFADKGIIVKLYGQACTAGDALACRYKSWHRPTIKERFKAGRKVFKKACNKGDLTACVALGWVLSQTPESTGYPNSKLRTTSKGIAAFKRACDGGVPRGCLELGRFSRRGVGTPEDEKRWLSYAQQSCDSGEMDACVFYAVSIGYKKSATKDEHAKMAQLLETACERGAANACNSRAYTLNRGIGGTKDPQRAIEYLKKACAGGSTAACITMAGNYNDDKAYAQSNDLFARLCEAEVHDSCTNRARNYENGRGGPKNLKKAAGLHLASCKAGHAPGCGQIARLYADGLGVKKSLRKAFKYYKQGCNKGNKYSCFSVAYAYAFGRGVPKKILKAARLWMDGCQQKFGASCIMVGHLFKHGYGVEQSLEIANSMYLTGCQLGDPGGCGHYGLNLREGNGIRRNRKEGRKYLQMGCDGGDKSSCDHL